MLSIPADQIGRHDHFFDRGGISLAAVKLAIALDRAVSLTDLTRYPVLADLAALVDSRSEPKPGLKAEPRPEARPEPRPEPRSGLLQCLSEADDAQAGALVCFPYAGGNTPALLVSDNS